MPAARRTAARNATLGDVAKLAGVSIATASKAINGREDVAPGTRDRVVAAAAELAFSPNQLARSLIAGRTGTVGLLTSDLEGRFVIPILMGAEDAFGAGQVNVILCDARGDAIREQHHLKALLNRRVDGIIVVGRQTDPRPSLGEQPVPVVYAYAPSDDPADLSLTPDNVAGGRLAVEHLLGTGRRRIAHISGDPAYAAAQDRTTGVRAALADAGLELVGDVAYNDWSEHWGRDAAAMLLAAHPEIDGIVCGSDQIARGVLDTLRDFDKRVPDDVAVIGYDNWEVLATQSRPELTSIDANLQQLGRAAAMRIFEAIDGADGVDGETGEHRLPVRLVIRGSTIARR
ncbi:LacI family DNA-binding transcriptional regulator [Agromyces seonyuensis]|uniref:Substrate-binding domain-containing protein n=1 Tax=Agromyces seonyuensis TaxID=2662446 RepID=A0A6I4NVH5_9MICO|nr:LacI family DNA-binding transcriptional regulator [Agromyces seonyuensis]MWB98111.1 substrate-binding domain-containing protein [Agromyces seonyuensis]